MVFGNKGETSGTGVCFTRDPSTGESMLYGEFLQNAQGEDVVAGIRTPEPITAMEQHLPEAFAQLVATIRRLEAHYRDMQDIEFTVEEGRLFLLQTRTGKRMQPRRSASRASSSPRASSRGKRRSRASIPPSSTSSCTR